MEPCLEFEKPIFELREHIEQLKRTTHEHVDVSSEMQTLEKKMTQLTKDVFGNLSPWQKVQLARHPLRPYSLDYIMRLAPDFVELHGDRLFADDKAIVGGIGTVDGQPVMFIGQQKGRNTDENIFRNFGMPNPEGYRKAMRLMKMAEKFSIPIVTFIDTPGAYPGIGAEERGQGEAIARNLRDMSMLETPVIVIVIGEGGSGGALAIGVGDVIAMLSYTIYSVISPEGCASILWRDAAMASTAAETLKLTPEDLLSLGVIDEILEEPLGGAHRDVDAMAGTIKQFIMKQYAVLNALSPEKRTALRYEKFKGMGKYLT